MNLWDHRDRRIDVCILPHDLGIFLHCQGECRLRSLKRDGASRKCFLFVCPLLQFDSKAGVKAASDVKNCVERLFKQGHHMPAQAAVFNNDADILIILVFYSCITEIALHDVGQASDLAAERVKIFFHQLFRRILRAEGIVLFNVNLCSAFFENLPGNLFLHTVNALLMDQMTRVKHDLKPRVLTVCDQAFYLRLLEIIPEITLYLKCGENVKKSFHGILVLL